MFVWARCCLAEQFLSFPSHSFLEAGFPLGFNFYCAAFFQGCTDPAKSKKKTPQSTLLDAQEINMIKNTLYSGPLPTA